MINVRYYRSNSEKKQEKVFGVFFTQAEPKAVKPVDETLKGKELAKDKARFEDESAKALLDAKFAALDEVRALVGQEGVLVAYEETKEEE